MHERCLIVLQIAMKFERFKLHGIEISQSFFKRLKHH